MAEPSRSSQPLQTSSPARIASNTGALVFGQVIQFPISFLASIFIVRSLGSDGYGIFAFVYAFMGLFDWLAGFGVENTLVREASRAEAEEERSPAELVRERGELFGSAVGLTSLTTAATAGLAVVLAVVLGYRGSTAVLLLIAGVEVIALVPPRVLSTVLQVRLQMWKAVATTSARHILWLAAVFVLARSSAPVAIFIAVRTVLAIVETTTITYISKREIGARLRFVASKALDLARLSWPLALMYLAIGIYYRVDRVMIEKFAGAAELGFYAVADNVGGLITVIPLAFSRSVYPEICKRLDSEERFEGAVRTSFRIAILVVGLIVVGLFSAGPFLVRQIYGSNFGTSGSLLRVLLLGQLGATYGAVLGVVLLAKSLQRAMMVATAVTACLNVLANLVAIPRWGAAGAAWVTVGSYWISSSLIFEFTRQTRKLNRQGLSVLTRAVPGLAVGMGSALLINNPVLAALGPPLLCLLAFLVAGLVVRSDWELALSLVPRRRGRPENGSDL
jgi:O-antigen/teichoic acid export membrane protein